MSIVAPIQKLGHTARRAPQAALSLAVATVAAALAAPVHANTVTWTGAVADPNSGTYTVTTQGTTAGFTAGQPLYNWNTSDANWTGDSTKYTVGDNVVFTDNFAGGTTIKLTSGNLNPASMTFSHVAGAAPTTYTIIRAEDFQNAGTNLAANTPFGSGASTALTLDTGFLGKVVIRPRSNGANLNGNTIVRSGILEISDQSAIPGGTSQNAIPLTLAGGSFYVNVNTAGNTTPASSGLTGPMTVISDSIVANDAGNNSRIWNGPINIASDATLTLGSIQGFRIDLSNANFAGSTGTIRLADVGSNTTTVAMQSNNNRGAAAVWDLGTGSSELLSSTGSSTFDLGALTGGANTKLSGSTTASSTTTYSVGARGDSTTFAGTIRDNAATATGLAALTKVGTGTLSLTNANTYTGPTTVSGGTLLVSGAAGSISGSAALTVNSGATLRIDNSTANGNRLGDTASVSLNQGNLVFTGNLATPTAETTGQLLITGGSNTVQTPAGGSGSLAFASMTRSSGVIDFRIDPNVAVSFAAAPSLVNGIIGGYATVNTNDWATLSGSNLAPFSAYATDTPASGWSTADNINLTNGATSTVSAPININSLRFAGSGATVSLAAGQTLNITTGGILATGASPSAISGAGSLTAGSAATSELLALVQDPAGTLTISAPITDNGAGAVTLVKAGPGKLVLSGSGSTYTGGTSLIGGTLAVGVANFFPAASNLTLNYGAALDIAGFNQTFNTVTLTDGSLLNSGSGAAAVTASTYDVRKGTVSASLAGTAALTKTTSGTVTLAAPNTYTGGTTVSAGTLAATADGAIPNGTLVVNGGGTLDIGASNQTVGTVTIGNSTSSSGTITGTVGVLSGASYDAQNGTVSAILGGTGGLTKNVNANVTLSGANTYTGATTVGAGTLTINSLANGGSASSIGASSNAASNLVFNGGTLLYNGSGSSTDRLFTLGGALTITNNGTGPLNFTNTATLAGGGALLTLNGTGTASLAPVIPGGGGVTKSGTGTWALAGANTYTGVTTVSQGTLSVNSLANGGTASAIGASPNAASNLVLNGGTLKYTGPAASTDRLFTLNASSTLDASGTRPVNLSNTGTVGGTVTATLTLAGTNAGNNTLAAVIQNGGASVSTSLVKSGSGTWVLTGNNTYTGATTVSAGKLVLGPSARNVLTNAGGAAIADGATLAFDYTGTTSPAPAIRTALQGEVSGNFGSGQFRATPADALHAIAMVDDGASTVTLTRQFYGDLNLDGTVNADDFALIDRALATGRAATWTNGDVNYDGVIDSSDYLKMDTSYGKINGTLSPDFLSMRESEFGAGYVAALTAAVPEPASLAAVLVGALPLVRRRRR